MQDIERLASAIESVAHRIGDVVNGNAATAPGGGLEGLASAIHGGFVVLAEAIDNHAAEIHGLKKTLIGEGDVMQMHVTAYDGDARQERLEAGLP